MGIDFSRSVNMFSEKLGFFIVPATRRIHTKP